MPSTRREPAFYDLDDSSEGFEYLNDSTGSYTVDPGEKTPLIKRTCRAIESAFCDDAKKLTSILLDWAKHTDEKPVRDALYALLRECELQGDAGYLKKVLSNFFLALTDPWKTRASSIMDIEYAELSRRATKGDADAKVDGMKNAELRATRLLRTLGGSVKSRRQFVSAI